jgi:ElaB/YqjD/DUF883 family membrane-anchored ribosome-binding protein
MPKSIEEGMGIMASSADTLETTGVNDELNEQAGKAAELFNNVSSTVNDAMQKGVTAVKQQIQTVRDYGVDGVKNDVSDFARKQPLKALLIAGGIGALAALIITRR